MTNTPGDKPNLLLIADALVKDLLLLSDEELLREARQDGVDPEKLANDAREQIQAEISRHNKARLIKAREDLNAAREAQKHFNVLNLPAIRKQQILSQFAANDGRLKDRLTMAARQGDGASEREIDDILKDLWDLGAIDDEGNPR